MPDKYAHERGEPRYPACGRATIRLVFDGVRLTGSGAGRSMVYPAVSGRPIGQGAFDYSADRQKLAREGPIPEGEYWIQPSELQDNAWYRVRNPRSAWGDHWITIHPFPSTRTQGRGGFFIHGGSSPGSAGCIDLTSSMNRFVADLRAELGGSTLCYVPLTVRYSR
jgi:type VI secretion system (T6SS) effector TldE1-like protein